MLRDFLEFTEFGKLEFLTLMGGSIFIKTSLKRKMSGTDVFPSSMGNSGLVMKSAELQNMTMVREPDDVIVERCNLYEFYRFRFLTVSCIC